MPGPVRITNETPLSLAIWRQGWGRQTQPLGPLETRDFEGGPGGLQVREASTDYPFHKTNINDKGPRSIVITENTPCSSDAHYDPLELTIENQTPSFIDVFRVSSSKIEEPFGRRLAPGETSVHPGIDAYQCLKFRATFTDELVGMYFTPGSKSAKVTVTNDFISRRTNAIAPEDRKPFGRVKLIGAERPTPPRSSRQDYISITTRNVFEKNSFNTVAKQILRDMEISGVDLIWDLNDTCELNSLIGRRDLRSLKLYADRVIIRRPLLLHRTHVTIFARELVFQDDGRIETTPFPYSGPARSPYRTEDGLHPATDETQTVAKYETQNGARGERAGDITLYVKQIRGLDQNRFFARGSDGQAGEKGGHKTVQKDLLVIKPQAIVDHMKDRFTDKEPNQWRWPARTGTQDPDDFVEHPDKMMLTDDVLNQGHVVHVTLVACDLRLITVALPIGRSFLPGGKHEWHSMTQSPLLALHTMLKTDDPEFKPSRGADAYASGTPGSGGDGGTITSHFVPVARHCDVGPGGAGPASDEIPGGKCEPNPAYALTIVIVRWSWPQASLPTVLDCKAVTQTDGDKANGSSAGPGSAGKIVAPGDIDELDWAHEAGIEAVLTCARDAFRNGKRQTARLILDPFYASFESAVSVDRLPPRLAATWVQLKALRNNLNSNLDYYGNPPGWVPRLNALSNFKVFNTIRVIASEVLYFAGKMEADYDKLAAARTLAQQSSTALENEIVEARRWLMTAYDQLPQAKAKLETAQAKLYLETVVIEDLRKGVEDQAESDIRTQRAFSACCQIVSGALKILPVGQPVTGQVGDMFGIASEIDWTQPDPWTPSNALWDKASKSIDNFTKDPRLLKLLTKGGEDSDDVAEIETQINDAKGEIKKQEQDLKLETSALEGRFAKLAGDERKAIEDQISQAKKTLKDVETSREAIEYMDELHLGLDDTKAQAESGLALYQQQLANLDSRKARLAQLAARIKIGTNKDEVVKRLNALNDEEIARQLKQRDDVEQLERDRSKLKDKVGKNEKQKKAKQEQLLATLKGVGDGVGKVGKGIYGLLAPLDPEDPKIKKLTAHLLDKDARYHDRYVKLKENVDMALAEKAQAVQELVFWQQQISTASAQIAANLSELSALSRQRLALDGVLDISVKTYLKGMQQRARDHLHQSLYNFIKAWQYESLQPVPDDLYSFARWTDRLRELAKENQKKKPEDTVLLSKADFEKIEKDVLNEQLAQLFVGAVEARNHYAKTKGNFWNCRLTEELLAGLQRNGSVTFNLVDDGPTLGLGKGSFKDINARIMKITLNTFKFELHDGASALPGFSTTITFRHSGESVILGPAGPDQKGYAYYLFRAGRGDLPIFWQFTWNHGAVSATKSSATKSPQDGTITPDADIPKLDDLLKDLVAAKSDLQLNEYMPGFFSDITLSWNHDNKKVREAIKAITEVSFRVDFCRSGTR